MWYEIAAALLRLGIPAVVSNQFSIRDTSAIAFYRSFYGALAAGESVEAAVSFGRRTIVELQYDWRDWGVSVLYLQSVESTLFLRQVEGAQNMD